MQKNIFQRGFTLIELLVVIAIIGILASVVLASLNDARSRGADAAITSSINNQRAAAELYYDANGNSYNGYCEDTDTINALNTVAGNGSAAQTCVDGDDVTGAWALEAQLVSDSGAEFYCVDSSGSATTTGASSITSSDAVCG